MNGKNEYVDKLNEIMDEEIFLDPEQKSLTDNPAKHIKLGIVSTTENVLINRNNSPTGTTSHVLEDEPRVMVPAQKWKGVEQSNMVKIARELDLMPDSYQQNAIKGNEGLLNPVSVIFGDTVTAGDDSGQIRGRVNYDWSYSYEPLAMVTKRIQHNTLSEDGTILKDENDPTTPASSALHKTQYVIPGTQFIRFNSLENTTPELFLFYISGLISTHSYGARKKIVGDNIQNEIVAISWGQTERAISSYSVLRELWQEEEDNKDLREKVINSMEEAYGKDQTIKGEDVRKIVELCDDLLVDEKKLKNLLEPVQEWIEESLPYFEKD